MWSRVGSGMEWGWLGQHCRQDSAQALTLLSGRRRTAGRSGAAGRRHPKGWQPEQCEAQQGLFALKPVLGGGDAGRQGTPEWYV